MFEQEAAESRPGVLRLGDLVAQTKTVSIERNGREMALKGYVWGRRIPRRIEAQVQQAYSDFPKQVKVKLDPAGNIVVNPETGDPETEVNFDMADYSNLLTRVACTLVEGLSPLEAEVMDFDEIRELLRYLEYLKPKADTQEVEPSRPLDSLTTTSIGERSPSDLLPSMALAGESS